MHCGHAFACIETVTERRRLRRLFLRFSFADCMHLAGGCRNEGEITAKTRWLCPFANCTKKQLFRRGYTSIFLLLACSLFCAVFFCVFLLLIICTLPAVAVTKARLRQKLASLCPFANCTKKQLFRHGNASTFLLLSGSLFCAVFFFAFFFCRL